MRQSAYVVRSLCAVLWSFGLCAVLALPISYAASIAADPTVSISTDEGSYVPELPRDAITEAEENALWEGVFKKAQQLRTENLFDTSKALRTVLYGWPVRMAPGLSDYAGFSVSAFVDHNAATPGFADFNNGSRTYDSHRGTDIALWPFSMNKLDAGEVQVIAAAAGTIFQSVNTVINDRNCPNGISSDGLGNYIVLQHADGRFTLYGHMKHNSLTAKTVGQSVAIGEYLGTVGSSGNSSGPHLHFEARTAVFDNNAWVDPFAGVANALPSGWLAQRPYFDSAINKVATGTAEATFTNCATIVTNIEDNFTFASPTAIYFQVYFRDYQNTLPTVLTVFDPNGNVFQTWNYTSATPFARALEYHKFYNFPANALPGTWHFRASYNGQMYDSYFKVNVAANTVPTAPIIGIATAGNHSALVNFATPVSNGGAAIDNYRATCAGVTGTASSSPITVTGLSNGVTRSCTVAAHNSVGWSAESATSNKIKRDVFMAFLPLLLD